MDYSLTTEYNNNMNRWDVKISGEVDIFSCEEFKSTLLELIAEKKIDLQLDCKELVYIDSTTLGALVSIMKEAETYNGKVSLINVRPNIIRLFKITNLDKVFSIEGDDNE